MNPTAQREPAPPRLVQHQGNQHSQRTLQQMQKAKDLRYIDDDVEAEATLFEWHAEEHSYKPKSLQWYAALAAGVTALTGLFLLLKNYLAALFVALAGGMMYYLAQKKPALMRYRIMTEGVAINQTLYHYDDLAAFNLIYQPGQTKTVFLRSKRRLVPLLHMEIGEADQKTIRTTLAKFLPQDEKLVEPVVDVIARRLGF